MAAPIGLIWQGGYGLHQARGVFSQAECMASFLLKTGVMPYQVSEMTDEVLGHQADIILRCVGFGGIETAALHAAGVVSGKRSALMIVSCRCEGNMLV
jgi:hypothetical protein